MKSLKKGLCLLVITILAFSSVAVFAATSEKECATRHVHDPSDANWGSRFWKYEWKNHTQHNLLYAAWKQCEVCHLFYLDVDDIVRTEVENHTLEILSDISCDGLAHRQTVTCDKCMKGSSWEKVTRCPYDDEICPYQYLGD